MRSLSVLLLALVLTVPLATRADDKPAPQAPPNVPGPRQGGDTMEDAVVFENLPFSSTGTTTGYLNDYDEACPYQGSSSPDVVYAYVPGEIAPTCEIADIDLHGSLYDTKVYVYDSQLNLIACNDDFYVDYTSKIENIAFFEDETYYIVIDGYGGDHGEYTLAIHEYMTCYVYCPPGFLSEGEPPLQNDVPDTYNSGCDGEAGAPAVVPLPVAEDGTVELCGLMGWYTVGGELRRDTDWFSLVIGASGTVAGIYDDNLGGTVQVITPGDCGDLEVQQTLEMSPCYQNELSIFGEPGTEVWLRIATRDTEPGCGGYTPQEWEYTLELQGLQAPVPVKTRSWSEVKALFHR